MSFGHIQEGRGRREGKREREKKEAVRCKFLCIFVQSYTNFCQARFGMEAWRTPVR